jgi:mono/diheme cytochrome c family protein
MANRLDALPDLMCTIEAEIVNRVTNKLTALRWVRRAKEGKGDGMKSRTAYRIGAIVLGLGFAMGTGVWAQTAWKAPESEKSKKNPLSGVKAVEQGKKVAQVNCVSCHGAGGKGDGAAAAALNPKPADWTSMRVQGESDGEIFWKISTGRGPMPPWKHLPENDRWALVSYIRSLKQ